MPHNVEPRKYKPSRKEVIKGRILWAIAWVITIGGAALQGFLASNGMFN